MELKKPAIPPAVLTPRPSVRLLSVAPTAAEIIDSPGRPYEALWNSLFARLLLSLLAVALPFLIIAGLVPDLLARWGVGPQILAVGLLVGVTALTARLVAPATHGDVTLRVLVVAKIATSR